MTMTELRSQYPELYDNELWAQEDDEAYERFMRDTTTEVLGRMAQNSLRVANIGERAFRLFVDRPCEDDGSIIVLPNEFAIGTKMPGKNQPTEALLRAHVVRQIINPRATLIVQPNDTRKENNLNLSKDEMRYMISNGSTRPIVDRIRSATGGSENVTVIGSSQGAVVAADYIRYGDPRAVAIVEAPNTIKRTKLQLALAFVASGAYLQDNRALSGLAAQTKSEEIKGLISYALGIPTRSNAALLSPMSKNTLGDALILGVNRGVGITHLWANKTDVSPDEANQTIASQIGFAHKNYEAFSFTGKSADHSSTSVYQAVVALGRRAVEISERP